jgi:hypothetical protein
LYPNEEGFLAVPGMTSEGMEDPAATEKTDTDRIFVYTANYSTHKVIE